MANVAALILNSNRLCQPVGDEMGAKITSKPVILERSRQAGNMVCSFKNDYWHSLSLQVIRSSKTGKPCTEDCDRMHPALLQRHEAVSNHIKLKKVLSTLTVVRVNYEEINGPSNVTMICYGNEKDRREVDEACIAEFFSRYGSVFQQIV